MSFFHPKPKSAYENLIGFLDAASGDAVLMEWLRRLPEFSDNERLLEVAQFTEKMRAAGEDERDIEAISLLRNRMICNAALGSLG